MSVFVDLIEYELQLKINSAVDIVIAGCFDINIILFG